MQSILLDCCATAPLLEQNLIVHVIEDRLWARCSNSLKTPTPHNALRYSRGPILQMGTPRLRGLESFVLKSRSHILFLPTLRPVSFYIIERRDLQTQTSLAFSRTPQLLHFAGLLSTTSEGLSWVRLSRIPGSQTPASGLLAFTCCHTELLVASFRF